MSESSLRFGHSPIVPSCHLFKTKIRKISQNRTMNSEGTCYNSSHLQLAMKESFNSSPPSLSSCHQDRKEKWRKSSLFKIVLQFITFLLWRAFFRVYVRPFMNQLHIPELTILQPPSTVTQTLIPTVWKYSLQICNWYQQINIKKYSTKLHWYISILRTSKYTYHWDHSPCISFQSTMNKLSAACKHV